MGKYNDKIDFDLKSVSSKKSAKDITKRLKRSSLTHGRKTPTVNTIKRSTSMNKLNYSGSKSTSSSIDIPRHKWSDLPINTRIGYKYKAANGKLYTFKSAFIVNFFTAKSGTSYIRVRTNKEYNIPVNNILEIWAYKKELINNLKGGKVEDDKMQKLKEDMKLISAKLDRVASYLLKLNK